MLVTDRVLVGGATLKLYNAAFLVTPAGETAAVYRKMHLVPFGEYIPGKQLLYFVSPLVERMAEFAPGASMVVLPVGEHRQQAVLVTVERQFLQNDPLHRARATSEVVQAHSREASNETMEHRASHTLQAAAFSRPTPTLPTSCVSFTPAHRKPASLTHR